MSKKESESLLNFVKSVTGEHYLKVEENLGSGFVRLNVHEAERRQAKHDIRSVEDGVIELLRNSRDALASKIFVASHKEGGQRRQIVVIDDGCGIPPELHERIFEARVTSKLETLTFDKYGIHGRGMALFSIRSTTDNSLVLSSLPKKGSVFKFEVDTQKLHERKDQSTFPVVRLKQGKPQIIRGPHNVVRTLLEFNLDHPQVDVYLGSPAEILATMRHLGKKGKIVTRDGKLEESNLKIWEFLSQPEDIHEFLEISTKYIGLEISERNAYRIINNEINLLEPLLNQFNNISSKLAEVKPKEISLIEKENLSKYIQGEDLEEFCETLVENFSLIGKKYFLDIKGKPKIWKTKSTINISINLKKVD